MSFFIVPMMASAQSFSVQDVVSLTNRDRTALGLSTLHFDETLASAAEFKALDMDAKGYFAHTSPEGVTPWTFFDQSGYRYRYAGENLAIHFTDAHDEHEAWMSSQKHRENILSSKYSDIGVAVREISWEGKKTTVVVQLFGTRIGEEVADATPWKSISGDVAVASNEKSIGMQADFNEAIVAPQSSVLPDQSPFTVVTGNSTVKLVILLVCTMLLEVIACGIFVRIFLYRDRSTPLVHSFSSLKTHM